MSRTKELIGYNVQIKGSNGYSNQFVYQDELDSYEPPFDYKVIGIYDVYQEPKPSEFTKTSDVDSYLETDKIITGRYGK